MYVEKSSSSEELLPTEVRLIDVVFSFASLSFSSRTRGHAHKQQHNWSKEIKINGAKIKREIIHEPSWRFTTLAVAWTLLLRRFPESRDAAPTHSTCRPDTHTLAGSDFSKPPTHRTVSHRTPGSVQTHTSGVRSFTSESQRHFHFLCRSASAQTAERRNHPGSVPDCVKHGANVGLAVEHSLTHRHTHAPTHTHTDVVPL